MIRIAAVADLHVRVTDRGKLATRFRGIEENADVLLLPGDLTDNGTLDEGSLLTEELAGIGVPVFAVLGNHDYLVGCHIRLCDLLGEHGIKVLDGEGAVIRVHEESVGIAGLRGFRGGFDPLLVMDGSPEPEVAAWRSIIEQELGKLEVALSSLRADYRVVMTHYSPIRATVEGENPEIVAFMGSSLLCEPIDRLGADLVVHGHTHHGSSRGMTPGGIPVYNVAARLLDIPYVIFELGQ